MGPGGFPGLQNQCDLTTSGWVGSIPARSRHTILEPLVGMRTVSLSALCVVLAVSVVGAQVPADTAFVASPLAGRVRARKQHVEDWVALLIFNHLFAAADAFVAAQLWDVPARVSVTRDGDRTRLTATVRW